MTDHVQKRSITIAGHATSLSLEDAFWSELKRIAKARGQSLNELIADIDETRTANLSSAVRVFVLNVLKSERPKA